jgi:hypothetical protein
MSSFLQIKFRLIVRRNYMVPSVLLFSEDVSTGWDGLKVNWWAKMLDSNHAYKLIKSAYTSGVQVQKRRYL